MHERRAPLDRLDEVRLDGVLQHQRHGALGLQIARPHGLAAIGEADHDLSQTPLEILDSVGQAQNGHDLARHSDLELILAWHSVRSAAEPDHDIPKGAVVHVQRALPQDLPGIDAERISVVHVVIDERRQQVGGGADRMDVAGEVEVDLLHRKDLRPATAGGSSLDPHARPHGWLAEAEDRALAAAVERLRQPDRDRRLAFSGGCRADAGHENEASGRGPSIQRGEPHLGHPIAVRLYVILRQAELACDIRDRTQLDGTGDLDVAHHAGNIRASG